MFSIPVYADSVSSVSVTEGAVTALVSFTCSDSTDIIRIYHSTSPGITTGDISSYDDPDDVNLGNRADRTMLIRNLTEDTKYYYRIYAVGEGWAAAEDSFRTLPRFTTEWKDEFFDDYYMDASSGVQLEQQSGTKYGSSFIGDNPNDYGYVTVIKYLGEYHMFMTNYTSNTYVTAFTRFNSSDGLNWKHQGTYTISGDSSGVHYGNWLYDGTEWYITYTVGESKGYIAESATLDGTYTRTLVGDPSDLSLSTCVEPFSYINTLGADKFSSFAKFSDGSTRHVGHFFGIDDTHWVGINEYSDYPKIPGNAHVYASPGEVKSGTFISFNHPYDTGDELIDCYLMVSRNGENWTAFDSSTPLIPLGSGGSFDDGMVFSAQGEPVFTEGNYDYIYYNGWDAPHNAPWPSGRSSAVSRIRWRRDGLTALDPTGGSGWYRTTSIPQEFKANFTVNGDFAVGDTCSIAVLYANNNTVISGFDDGDFTTLNTDSLSHSPTWGANNLDDIPNVAFKLNFTFSGTGWKLYSFFMDNMSTVNTSSLEFYSINSQGNNSVVFTDNRTFVWTKISGATQYQLQIANDSGFVDVFRDIASINESTYPSQYSENATHVQFYLPVANEFSFTGWHYYRVRSYG